MYNTVPPDQIPPLLPVAATVLLKTWFDQPIIEQGLTLLRQGSLSQFFVFRNVATGMISEKRLTLVFERTDRITRGFTLKQEHCGLCGTRTQGKRCQHIAALCILSLQAKPDGSYLPVSLGFKQSIWRTVADILYNWLSGEKGKARLRDTGRLIELEKKTQDGGISAAYDYTVSPSTAFLKTNHPDETITPFFDKIQQLCTTKNEQLLLKAGTASKGLEQDRSIWTGLCTLVYCCIGDTPPRISYSLDKNRFELELGDASSVLWVTADLPRSRTFEILRKLGKIGKDFHQLPDGRPGSNVALTPEGKILVSPIVRLADGRVLSISGLADQKFGNYYYLNQEGFFRISGNNSEAKILTENNTQKIPSLVDFLHKDHEFSVEPADRADFLERNQKQLRHPDNQVAAEVLTIRHIDVPDGLIIFGSQEEDGWIVLNCRFTIGDQIIPPDRLWQALSENQPLTAGFTTLELQKGPLAWLPEMLARTEGSSKNGAADNIRLTRGEFANLIGAVPCVTHRDENVDMQRRLARLSTPDNQSLLNLSIRYQDHLRDYQKNGLSWLFTLYELGLGGILADDMGLGKTHQALSLIETIIRSRNTEPSPSVLVVCPTSVLLHWVDKIDRFYPKLRYALYYGPGRELGAALKQDVIFTTYAITRADRDILTHAEFDLIIYDEIQALKNRSTATHQACRTLHSRVAIGLSGTPIENSLEDLFSIFSICLPGFFGPFKSFEHTFIKPIEKHGSSSQERQLTERISPFVLRRSRAQVLVELPELIEDDRICELSEKQLELYKETISSRQPLLNDLADQNVRIDYLHVFAMLSRLKQICNHPCLVEECTDPGQYPSGKWDLFVELLNECLDSGRKVVVFSQYLGMLELIDAHLAQRRIGFASLRGDMGMVKRQQMIDTFATDINCRVFTASLLAGGTGIDLISGNAVIHYDRWWNPAKEDQATARVHRMGQKDVVHLFRLSTRGTLEEKINAIISEKKLLSEAIIREDELGMIQRLSRAQLLELFSL